MFWWCFPGKGTEALQKTDGIMSKVDYLQTLKQNLKTGLQAEQGS